MNFWESKPLNAMSEAEWEQLCDGCGRCCVIKYEDEDSGEVVETNAACRLLDCETCRCGDYANRFTYVPDCTRITPELLADDKQRRHLPYSCAYRRLAEGRELADWHPLISGDPATVITAGVSLAGQLISERDFDETEFIDVDDSSEAGDQETGTQQLADNRKGHQKA